LYEAFRFTHNNLTIKRVVAGFLYIRARIFELRQINKQGGVVFVRCEQGVCVEEKDQTKKRPNTKKRRKVTKMWKSVGEILNKSHSKLTMIC